MQRFSPFFHLFSFFFLFFALFFLVFLSLFLPFFTLFFIAVAGAKEYTYKRAAVCAAFSLVFLGLACRKAAGRWGRFVHERKQNIPTMN